MRSNPNAHRRGGYLPVIALVVGLMMLGASAVYGQQRDVAGMYSVTGTNPGGMGEYRGDVIVVQDGEVYQVAWTIAGARYVGTGVLLGAQLSIVYAPDGQVAGIAVYELQADGTLQGVWTGLGGRRLGTERWVPRGRT